MLLKYILISTSHNLLNINKKVAALKKKLVFNEYFSLHQNKMWKFLFQDNLAEEPEGIRERSLINIFE